MNYPPNKSDMAGSVGGTVLKAVETTWPTVRFESRTQRLEDLARHMFTHAQNPKMRMGRKDCDVHTP